MFITIAMVMLPRDFGLCGIIVVTVFPTLDFPVIVNGQFTSTYVIIMT
jgi:hypothetical protein